MRTALQTAGEQVEITCAHGWLAGVLAEGLGSEQAAPACRPDVRISVEDTAEPFDTAGWAVLTRDAWRRPGQVIVRNACSSGLDLLVTVAGPTLEVAARWRPALTGRAASALLRARARLLIRAVLLQYPALWRAQQHGRAPLHASVCTAGPGRAVLIAGPGGVGKSTLVNAELGRGGKATSDNICVSDGHSAWGLLEPRRVPAGEGEPGGPAGAGGPGRGGRRMPHGRREAPWLSRVGELTPDLLVVLRRGTGAAATARPCAPQDAARFLAAGTYMAGELRRYWAFAATLALGTGAGDPHPAVGQVASALAASLPCTQIILGERPGALLEGLLDAGAEAEVHR